MVLLRKLREEQGLSMNKLAQKLGINSSVIANMENKQYKTNNNTLKKLAEYFKIENPLDLYKNADRLLKSKKCLNQRCGLNKECYCQSDQVVAGAFCKSENEVSEPLKVVKFNNTNILFEK